PATTTGPDLRASLGRVLKAGAVLIPHAIAATALNEAACPIVERCCHGRRSQWHIGREGGRTKDCRNWDCAMKHFAHGQPLFDGFQCSFFDSCRWSEAIATRLLCREII